MLKFQILFEAIHRTSGQPVTLREELGVSEDDIQSEFEGSYKMARQAMRDYASQLDRGIKHDFSRATPTENIAINQTLIRLADFSAVRLSWGEVAEEPADEKPKEEEANGGVLAD